MLSQILPTIEEISAKEKADKSFPKIEQKIKCVAKYKHISSLTKQHHLDKV